MTSRSRGIRARPTRNSARHRLRSLPAAASVLLVSASTVLGADGGTSGSSATDPVLGDPLVPYIVALLVAGLTLLVVGIVVVVSGRRKTADDRRTRAAAGWWRCEICDAENASDRRECYACQAPRDRGTEPSAGDEPDPAPGSPGRPGPETPLPQRRQSPTSTDPTIPTPRTLVCSR